MAVVYHWRHGWIPLDHEAALSKAKGNHAKAASLLSAARGNDAGINSRRDVAGAVKDLPNVPHGYKTEARHQVLKAAAEHHATDLLPSEHARRAEDLRAKADAKSAEAERIANHVGFGDTAAGRLNASGLKQFHKNTDSSLRKYVAAQNAAESARFAANAAQSRADEAAREKFTRADLNGITHVHDGSGWHEVIRVNGKTVTVKTPYSWTDTIAHGKIKAVAVPGSAAGKSTIFKTPSAKRAAG